MSYSFSSKNKNIHYIYNNDFSGDMQIVDDEKNIVVEVPCEDILGLVAEYIRSKRISKIENMTQEELLS